MRILLDTHLLLWAAGFPKRLSPQAREIIGSSGNAIFFSVASLWEIEIKATLGREDFRDETVGFRRGLIENDYLELPISGEHALSLRHLPSLHRDPFDRILLAQSLSDNLLLLTSDETLARYPLSVRKV
jgi:PIN domain nuclease of toxin-antitoxin system